jgi:hypothetical protein
MGSIVLLRAQRMFDEVPRCTILKTAKGIKGCIVGAVHLYDLSSRRVDCRHCSPRRGNNC